MSKKYAIAAALAASGALALPTGASAHGLSVAKGKRAAEKKIYATALMMDLSYGGGETYYVGNCAKKGRHKVVCDYQINGRNDTIGQWQCYGKVTAKYTKHKSKKILTSFTMQHTQEL